MGQSLKKLARKDDAQKKKEIVEKMVNNLEKKITEKAGNITAVTAGEFYHEISKAVEEMNKSESGFQFNCPTEKEIKEVYDRHRDTRNPFLTQEEFEKIMRDLAFKGGAKGIGEMLLYIYGFPISATLIKQAVFPELVSDDIFIPLVTAATVLILGKTKGL